jgi:Mrp family chromosome partitioning ATPase
MSIIQKVLEAEKKRNAGRRQESRSLGQATKELAAATGIFKGLSIASIRSKAMEQNKILPAIDDRGAITAYKMLRTRVLQRMRSNDWRTLIVSGAGPGEGKTLTACNLAVSISNDVNQAVILVDLDLPHPSLAKYFGLDVKAGIGDYLTGKAELDDIVYTPSGLERMVIIPNRDTVSNSSELVASPRMRTLMDWLKNQGPETITIFDMPPVLACDDVLAFSPYADAILMVVAEGMTDRSSLARTMEMIGDRNLLGVVLNQSREKDSVTSYYY